jgi:hypothetical protein
MVRSEEVNERIAEAVEMAAEVEKDKPKKKKRRNKSGLISRTPLQVMQASDFNNLVNQNTLYKNILITYVKMGFYNGLPVNEKLSLYDIQKTYKHYLIIKKDHFRVHIAARTKNEAIELTKTPKREILSIIRINLDGKEAYLKVGVPKC